MIHKVHKVTLANGAKGLFVDIPDASVMNFEINFRAGEYLVDRKKLETPHLMEHMLLGANQKIKKTKAFQAEFEKNGAYCNASTDIYDINYEAECADFEWDRIAELLFLAIDKPLFLRHEFSSEFGNVKEELVYRSNNHFRHLSLAMKEAFGFMAVIDQERLQLMENVKLKDVRSHYKKTHFASNMRFVIGGKLPIERRQKIIDILSQMSMPKGPGRLALPKEKPIKIDRPVRIENETVKNLYFYIDTFLKRKIKISEAHAAELLDIILTETYYSKILGTAREKGIAYHVDSSFSKFNGNANWWLSVQISPDNILELLDIVVREIKKIFMGKIADKDIRSAKQYALGRFQRAGQTVGYMVGSYSSNFFSEEKVHDYYKYPKRIESVSKQQIISITKDLFSQDVWGIGGLGNSGDELMTKVYDKLAVLWQ
ncbi:MAG TPA: pitrilysin family protein [Candidatus Dormibacteraeota bacterium]|nr:pitrilysin family protein [Candidatus Dormibacteraeota bacterium]